MLFAAILIAGRILPLRHRPRPEAAQPALHLVVDRGRLAHRRPGLCGSGFDHGRYPLSLFRRLLLALLAFGGTSTALLTVTSQIVPGWRPAGIQRPLDPRPAAPADEPEVHKVRQTSAEITVEGSPDLAAWILQPAESNEARAVPGLVLVHGAGRGSRESLVETAQAFAAAGTAVIIYDKRTAGYWCWLATLPCWPRTPSTPPTCSRTRRVSIRSGLGCGFQRRRLGGAERRSGCAATVRFPGVGFRPDRYSPRAELLDR